MILFDSKDFRIEGEYDDEISKSVVATLADVFSKYRWDENSNNEPVKIVADFPDGQREFVITYKNLS